MSVRERFEYVFKPPVGVEYSEKQGSYFTPKEFIFEVTDLQIDRYNAQWLGWKRCHDHYFKEEWYG